MNSKSTELQRSLSWRALMALALCGWFAFAAARAAESPEAFPATGSFECRALGGIFARRPHSLASASEDNTIKLWDVEVDRELRTPVRTRQRRKFSRLLPDGRTLASGGGDNLVKLWDVATGYELRTLSGHAGRIYSVAFSRDGQIISVCERRSSGQTVGRGQRPRVARALSGHKDAVRAAAFSADGRTLATGSVDKTIKLWDVRDGRELRTLGGHTDWISSVGIFPRRAIVGLGQLGPHGQAVDLASGREVRTFAGHSNQIWSVAFSSMARPSSYGQLRSRLSSSGMWEGRELRSFCRAFKLGLSPRFLGGRSHACLGRRGSLWLSFWDVASARELRTLSAPFGICQSGVLLCGRPHRSLSAAGGQNHQALGGMASGRIQRTLIGHSDFIRSLAFSPDGRTSFPE